MPDALPALSEVILEIEHQIPLLDAKKSGAEIYSSPKFSLFGLFNPNENAITRLVSDLFDPRGTHGQGAIFLNILLVKLGLPRVGVRDIARVQRELLTRANRRIDLVIETNSLIIGIENKPWAAQQPRQLSDYLEELRERSQGRPFRLIFLSDQEEKTAKGEAIRMPYQAMGSDPSLFEVLTLSLDEIKSARVRDFVQDFMRFIDLQFGQATMTSESDDLYIRAVQNEFDSRPGKRKALAAVLLAHSNLHEQVLNEIGAFILTELQHKLSPDFELESDATLYDCLQAKWATWAISRPSWPENCVLGFDSDKGQFRDVYFGVKAPDPTNSSLAGQTDITCKAREKLEKIRDYVSDGRRTTAWPWWQYADLRNLGLETVARLVLESPNSRVSQHPEVQEFSNRVIQLAQAVEKLV